MQFFLTLDRERGGTHLPSHTHTPILVSITGERCELHSLMGASPFRMYRPLAAIDTRHLYYTCASGARARLSNVEGREQDEGERE